MASQLAFVLLLLPVAAAGQPDTPAERAAVLVELDRGPHDPAAVPRTLRQVETLGAERRAGTVFVDSAAVVVASSDAQAAPPKWRNRRPLPHGRASSRATEHSQLRRK